MGSEHRESNPFAGPLSSPPPGIRDSYYDAPTSPGLVTAEPGRLPPGAATRAQLVRQDDEATADPLLSEVPRAPYLQERGNSSQSVNSYDSGNDSIGALLLE